jgi:hypothetical protein
MKTMRQALLLLLLLMLLLLMLLLLQDAVIRMKQFGPLLLQQTAAVVDRRECS